MREPTYLQTALETVADVGDRTQLVLKWARFGSDDRINVTEDLSNLALDTVAMCTMDYRFNSFYNNGAHPFVKAMNTSLAAASANAGGGGIPIISGLISKLTSNNQLTPEDKFAAQETMRNISQTIIEDRRQNPKGKNDFLNMLLFNKDPKTNEVMRDELIQAQMLSFLIAGHETTSGLLSFCVFLLLQNPEKYQKCQEEIDRICGGESITVTHIRQLKYIYAALQETLRIYPTAPFSSKIPHPDAMAREGVVTLDGGKYQVPPDVRVRILYNKCLQDPQIFGDDAREFRPERFLDGDEHDRIEPYWRPFSEGSRACIGRNFSLQEAQLALAMIIQNFDLRLADPLYKMRIVQAVTIKPGGLFMKAGLRHGMTPLDLDRRLKGEAAPVSSKTVITKQDGTVSTGDGAPLTILFGSNQGTCQALAQKLASEASTYGYDAQAMDMDACVGKLSTSHPTIIVTASYEGEPPDNALQFVQWLKTLQPDELKGVRYAVYGCGDRNWHATYHKIPRLVDEAIRTHGGDRLAEIGLCDVQQGNPMADFEDWLDCSLSPKLKELSGSSADSQQADVDVEATISTGDRVATLHQDLQVGTVKEVKILTAKGEQPEKRHMEVTLPEGQTYECGDYLAILPQSPEANVRAILAHFKMPLDATITLKSKVFAPLPLNTSLGVADLLRNYFELAKPATKRSIILALKYTSNEEAQRKLSTWTSDEAAFTSEITDKKTSVFEILRQFPAIEMPFATFLSLLPPLSVRQYSISSSPLRNEQTCTITYSVLNQENDADNGKAFYGGVTTTYLSTLRPGDRIQCSTRRTAKSAFRLPLSQADTPLLMFAAGTGLAPFRGFIEQRACQLQANPNTVLAPAHLFIGCRSPTKDRLYASELDSWAKLGAVELHYAYSREPAESQGCKYIDELMMKEKDVMVSAWANGARAFICGNRAVSESVARAARALVEAGLKVRRERDNWSEEDVEARKKELVEGFRMRAAQDVFD